MALSAASKVMLGKANFSADQVYLIAKYFDLPGEQASYLELLLEHERCALVERKKKLSAEIRKARERHLQTPSHIGVSLVNDEKKALEEYYLDPFNGIVHMVLLIERMAKSPKKIAHELGITEATVERALKTLMRLGIVGFSRDHVVVKEDSIHLPKESPVFKSWRSQARVISQHRLAQVDECHPYSVSITFTAKEDDRKMIQAKFLAFLKEIEKVAQQKNPDQVFQLNFDLFSWLGMQAD